jgi:dethiobiotin synthetase
VRALISLSYLRLKQIFFITGTDTGVGKTVLTVLMAQFLRQKKINVAALKPICSGGRGDARKIFKALNGVLALDEINPWHFRDAIAPALAAKSEKKPVKLSEVVARVRATQKNFDVILIEGAGGLLSPLGENFDARDLILALRASPMIVAQNKLGALNSILLTLEALPKNVRAQTKIILMSPRKKDLAGDSNAKLLADFFPRKNIFSLPWFGQVFSPEKVLKNLRVQKTLRIQLKI